EITQKPSISVERYRYPQVQSTPPDRSF
ncbi:hypothetical protein AVDCRST_MAG84-6250, partial [uncultured Microcoleus sp.]